MHIQLEQDIADFLGTEASIIYSQALSTISSVIPAFCKRGDIIVADRKQHDLSHACLSRDGSRIAWVPADGRAKGTVIFHRFTGGEFIVLQHGRDVKSISLSQDGEYVAVLPDSRSFSHLSVFRTQDGKHVFQDGRAIGVSCVSFGGCRMGEVPLAYGLKDGTVRLVRMGDVDMEE